MPLDGEIWGLPWDELCFRYDVWFEMHDRSLWERRGPEYLERLIDSPVPIYMQREEPDIPNSVAFPVEDMARDYFSSSIAYMLALAVHQGKGIALYGVDNHEGDEWAQERPCNEWWLGLAQGRGLDVWVHPSSSLLRPALENLFLDELQTYEGRYGWLEGT